MRRIQKYFYFAITEYEKKYKKEITYPLSSKYKYKGVHSSLEAIRKFIKLEFPNKHNWFYIRIPQSMFSIDHTVVSDEENMIAVELPFTIDLTHRKIYNLF